MVRFSAVIKNFLSQGHTGRQHALDIVLAIAENDSVTLSATAAGWTRGQRLDLKTLEYRNGKLALCGLGVGEDGAEQKSLSVFPPNNQTADHGGVRKLTSGRPPRLLIARLRPTSWVSLSVSNPSIGALERKQQQKRRVNLEIWTMLM